jgi:hypothetical protein
MLIAVPSKEIVGGAVWHAEASAGGYVEMSATGGHYNVTLTGTPNFSGGFVVADGSGYIAAPLNTFIGGATGPHFFAQTNGVIWTEGKSQTYFPGSIA